MTFSQTKSDEEKGITEDSIIPKNLPQTECLRPPSEEALRETIQAFPQIQKMHQPGAYTILVLLKELHETIIRSHVGCAAIPSSQHRNAKNN